MDAQGMVMKLFNPNETVMQKQNEKLFVDEANLVVKGPDPHISVKTKSQQHEQLLHATGGQLALHKFEWNLIQRAWDEVIAHLQTYPAEIQVYFTDSSPHKLSVTESETQRSHTIKKIHPTTSYRTLGVHISADGGNSTQVKIITDKITEWARMV